jgi:hypothetical protein
LAARLVAEEASDAKQQLIELGCVVEDHHGAGAEGRPNRPSALEAERHVEVRLGNERARGTAQENSAQAPSFT